MIFLISRCINIIWSRRINILLRFVYIGNKYIFAHSSVQCELTYLLLSRMWIVDGMRRRQYRLILLLKKEIAIYSVLLNRSLVGIQHLWICTIHWMLKYSSTYLRVYSSWKWVLYYIFRHWIALSRLLRLKNRISSIIINVITLWMDSLMPVYNASRIKCYKRSVFTCW